MASPFRIFRKHQKKLLATLGIMAIVAFCVPYGIFEYLRQPSATLQVVVKTSSYGDLNENTLNSLVWERRQILRFLRRVQAEVVETKRQANLLASEADRVAEIARVAEEAERRIGPATEEVVVDTWLCAKHAEQLGMNVSDEAIEDFIVEVTEDLLKGERVSKIIAEVNVNQRRFFEILRRELLALRVRLMFGVSASPRSTTPAQRWEYYTRLTRLANIEAIPVPVADYVDKIKGPNETTLRRFFEKHKSADPDPTTPEQGFRKPHQIAVRYFKADIDKFMAPEVVTEEDVRKHYEENKDYYDLVAPRAPEEPGPEEKGATEKQVGDEPTAKEPKKATEGQESAEEPRPGKTEVPAGEKGEDAARQKEPPDEPSADDAAETDEGEETAEQAAAHDEKENKTDEESPNDGRAEEADGPAVEPKSGDMSSVGRASPFSLTSLFQEATGQPDETPAEQPMEGPMEESGEPEPNPELPAEEPDGPALGPEMLADQTEPTDKTQPGDKTEAPDEAQTPDPTAGDAKQPAEGPTDTADDSPKKGVQDDQEKPKDPLAGPLGDLIRRQLAGQKVAEIFDRLQDEMNAYHDERLRYEIDRETNPNAVPPEEPDYDALAKKEDPTGDQALTTRQTPLMSQWDFRDEPSGIGRSSVGGGIARDPFRHYAFGERFELHVAAQSSEIERYLESSRYLFWKVKDSKAKVLKFEDRGVRQQVLEAWKMVEARKLAIKAAEALADEARAAELPLDLTFIERLDVTVISPRKFSWMTYGNVAQPTARTRPWRSEVTGVEMAGDDFMRTVFSLQRGQIGVAFNQPKTIAYVIRLSEVSPPTQDLWAQFIKADSFIDYLQVAIADSQQMHEAWRAGLRNSAGLRWERPPRREQRE